MKCAVHSDKEAIGACVSCGKGICEECKVESESKFYCKECDAKKASGAFTTVETASEQEIEDGKVWAVLGYIGILFLVPLLMKKDNSFARFHAKQGMVIFIAWIALAWVPYIGRIGIAVLTIVSIIGIIKAIMGEMWKIPVVGDLAEKIKI